MPTKNIETSNVATHTELLSESLQMIRVAVVTETDRMATNAPHIRSEITSLATGLLDTVSQFDTKTEAHRKGNTDMLSAESLYQPITPDGYSPTGIVRIYQIINEYDKYLANAINCYDEELHRESEMTLFRRMPYELDHINISSSNIGEVATALKVALMGNNTRPYRLDQIISLRKVLSFIKKDISIGEQALMEILSILDDQFGLAGPLAEVPFIE